MERTLRWMMPALFIMILMLVAFGLTLPNAMAGVRHFLMPDFSKLGMSGVLDAMGLAFFSLSIGLGIHTTYGAYLPSSDGVGSSSLWVVLLASLIAVLAGLMIFPVLAATGIDPASGPGLTFMTMPAVFQQLPFGQGLAVVFFALLVVAALSSAISLLEHLQCFVSESLGWSRRAACGLITALVMAGDSGQPVVRALGAGDPVWQEYLRAARLRHLQPDDAHVRVGAHPAAGLETGAPGAARRAGAALAYPGDGLLALAGTAADRRHPGARAGVIRVGGWAAAAAGDGP